MYLGIIGFNVLTFLDEQDSIIIISYQTLIKNSLSKK